MAKKKTKKKTTQRAAKTPAKSKRAAGTVKRNGMVVRRSDLGADVGVYFAKQKGAHRAIAEALHKMVVKAVPEASGAIKWGMPVYEHHGMLCYIRVRPKYVTFGFYAQGTSLNDPRGLLEGTGDNMRHVKLALDAPVPAKELAEWVKQAAQLNEQGLG